MSEWRHLLYRYASTLMLGLVTAVAFSAEIELAVSSSLFGLKSEVREQQVAERMQATPMGWPAARMTIAEAVQRLAASGNTTTLGTLIDPTRQADVPAVAGDYWQAIIAVCVAFDVVIELGEVMDVGEDSGRFGNRDNNGTAVVMTGGAVRLVQRPPNRNRPLYVSCGLVLAEVGALNIRVREGSEISRTAEIQTMFRFEPRVRALQVGTTLAAWRSVEDALGRRLEWSESAKETQGDVSVVHLSAVPEPFNGCTLVGELLVQTLEPVSLSATMRVGDKARTTLLGQEVTIHLIGEGETTANGQRGPGFSLSVPTAVLGTRPTLQVQAAGQSLQFNNQGSHWSGGRIELFYRGPRQLEGAFEVSLFGQAALQQIRVPVTMPITLASLPKGEKSLIGGMELQVPTRVRWDAGEFDLKTAIGFLSQTNQVLLELGANEQNKVLLPAFDGQFWEGVLAICRAFDLTILPPSQSVKAQDDEESSIATCLTSGPLCLGQRRGDRVGVDGYQASGILLLGIDDVTVITNHALDGLSRQAEISYRLRLEPRLDASLIGAASVSWTSLGGIDAGRPLVVEEAPMQANNEDGEHQQMRFMRVGKRLIRVPASNNTGELVSASGVVTVTGLPTDSVNLSLNGQVSLQLKRPVRSEITVVADERAIAMLGDKSLVVRMLTSKDEQLANGNRRGISVEMANDHLDALNLDLRDSTGKSIRSTGNGNNGANGRMRLLWYFADMDNGPYTVVLTARERMATFRLPFVLTTKTP
jgi:hypothetical protein